jgi:hypothetical protein
MHLVEMRKKMLIKSLVKLSFCFRPKMKGNRTMKKKSVGSISSAFYGFFVGNRTLLRLHLEFLFQRGGTKKDFRFSIEFDIGMRSEHIFSIDGL